MKDMELTDLYDIVFNDKIKKYINLSSIGSSYSSEEIVRIIKNVISQETENPCSLQACGTNQLHSVHKGRRMLRKYRTMQTAV